MAITKPDVLPVWADSGDKVQPTNPEISEGWPLSNVNPSRQRFNWFFNYVMNGIRYQNKRGLPDWDAAESYGVGDTVIGDDGRIYRSISSSNVNKTPSTSGAQWKAFGAGIQSGATMAFFQAAAPTGWTQVTSHNNKSIRIVSGVGGGAGGSLDFTTVFAARNAGGLVGYHNLTIAEMPPHSHAFYIGRGSSGTVRPDYDPQDGNQADALSYTENTGSGDGHTHTFTGSDLGMALKYVDMILATQD